VRAEVRPGSQTGRFRSRRRDEVATTSLPAGERAQAQVLARINTADEGALERSVGANSFETLNDGLVSKPRHAKRGGVSGGVFPADRCQEAPRHPPRRVR
jgi:hypothetical protein